MSNFLHIIQIYSSLTTQFIPTPIRGQSMLGYLILSIIISPVIILLLASVLGKPRKTKITVLFLGFIVFMLGAFITITYVLSFFTGFFF